MIPRSQRCNVCGCDMRMMPEQSCGIIGRIYVNTAYLIEGVTPPCPRVENERARFETIDAYWLGGNIEDEFGIAVANQEQGEASAAIDFARFLGVLHQDFRTSGFGEDDVSPGEIIGGDPLGDLARAYCVPEFHDDGSETS